MYQNAPKKFIVKRQLYEVSVTLTDIPPHLLILISLGAKKSCDTEGSNNYKFQNFIDNYQQSILLLVIHMLFEFKICYTLNKHKIIQIYFTNI